MSKVVLVTGSAKGIGKAIILEFAKNGYDCVINYNTSKDEALNLLENVKAYGVKALAIKCDVSNEEEVRELKELRNEVYSTGDADYAGRYIFTGYRTDTALTMDESNLKQDFKITENTRNILQIQYKDCAEE